MEAGNGGRGSLANTSSAKTRPRASVKGTTSVPSTSAHCRTVFWAVATSMRGYGDSLALRATCDGSTCNANEITA
jgi:hypothetical protein